MFGNNDGNDQQGTQFQQSPTPLPTPMLTNSLPMPPNENPQPPQITPLPYRTEQPLPQPAPTQPYPAPASDDGLMAIKSDALASLTPLVGEIDQSPEEKFKTTMMLIQASDNSSLIKEAYAAANQISDSKARAQALIDVINEINYFTQKTDKK